MSVENEVIDEKAHMEECQKRFNKLELETDKDGFKIPLTKK